MDYFDESTLCIVNGNMEGFTKFVLKIKETEMNLAISSITCNLQPFTSHDLIVNSPFLLLHISM